MKEFFRTYRTRPWPKLEIPPIRKTTRIGLIILTVGLLAAGWAIWFSGRISAEKYILLGLVIPLFFFLKNRLVTIVGLLTFQVLIGFIFIGNQDYAIMAVLILVGAIIVFEMPILIYVLLVVAVWIDMTPFSPPHMMRTEFAIAIGLVVGWLFRDILKPKLEMAKVHFPEKVFSILFLIWAAIGVLGWCPETVYGLTQLKGITIGVTFFVISPYMIRNEKSLNTTIYAWIVVGMLAAASIVVAPSVGYEPEIVGWGASLGAMGIQKNWSAVFFSFAFFVSLACFYWMRGLFRRTILGFCMLSIMAATLYQQSRSAAAGMLVGFVFFWIVDAIYTWRKNFMKTIIKIFLLVATGGLMIILIYFTELGGLFGSYEELLEDPTGVGTMETRLILWEGAYDMIRGENHPIRGLGSGAFWILGPDYGIGSSVGVSDDPEEMVKEGINPHSLYIDTFLHYGFPGIFLFLIVAFSMLVRLGKGFVRFHNLKYRYLCLGLFCGLLAFFVHCLFDFTVFIISRFWLYLGLAAAIANISRHIEASEQFESTSRI